MKSFYFQIAFIYLGGLGETTLHLEEGGQLSGAASGALAVSFPQNVGARRPARV